MDFIESVMEKTESFSTSCRNCTKKISYQFLGNGGFYCSGVVKFPSKDKPFDVIRLCSFGGEDIDYIDVLDMAPDEALAKMRLLNATVLEWLEEHFPPYDDFRGRIFTEKTQHI